MHHLPSRHRVFPYVVGVIIGLALMAPSAAFAVIHPAGDVPTPIVQLSSGYAILIDKQGQRLFVFHKEGTQIKTVFEARCSTGKNPGSKMETGDAKTPEGIFFATKIITEKKTSSIYGPLAIYLDYPNYLDRKIGKNGYNIWIHGTNKPLEPFSTNGCVALQNGDIEKLVRFIQLQKTPIIIQDSVRWVSEEQQQSAKADLQKTLAEWQKALTSGHAAASDYLYAINAPAERQQQKEFLSALRTVKGLDDHYLLSARDVSIFKQDRYAVIQFDQILAVQPDGGFRGTYLKLFLENHNGRWGPVREVAAETPVTLLAKASATAVRKPSAPRPAVPSSRIKPDSEADTAEVVRFVEAWRSSWEKGDLSSYRSCYAKDFTSRSMNLDVWIAYKGALQRRYKKIRVRVEGLSVEARDGSISAVFIQKYSAPGIKTSGKKKLDLKREDGKWKISRETFHP
ncbi:MAG: L,D-transpeptidase family protein [Syntrophales bacterium]|jgi:murein L,D-transpeptidase YafK|nr:L,D-transpeptidase family protein [Syntrophales bacterium]